MKLSASLSAAILASHPFGLIPGRLPLVNSTFALDCTFNSSENWLMEKAAASPSAGDLPERRFSGTLSDDYELWRLAHPFLGEVHEVVFRAVHSFTQARNRPLRALDIGMGMGDGAITGLLLADIQLSVTGVDNEPKMIKKAP